ncbi:putative bifunctional diguanylate cyclase/phosphodiesterase [Hydrogenophaga soli]
MDAPDHPHHTRAEAVDAVHEPIQPPAAPPVRMMPLQGRLGRRLVGRLAVVLLLVGGAVLTLGQYLLNRSFDSFERAAADDALVRVRTVLQRDSQTLGELLVDYAHWDDFYAFLRKPSDTFMDDNFTASSMRNIRVQAVQVMDLQGKVLKARYATAGGLEPELPPAWRDAVSGERALGRCQGRVNDLVWVQEQALMVSWSPMRNTAADKPSRGCLVMMRLIDADYIGALQPQLGVKFDLLPQAGALLTTQRDGLGHWVSQQLLSPWPATLQVRVDESLADERRGVMWWMVGGFALLAGVGGMVLYSLLYAMVIRRLMRFSYLADEYRITGDWSISWPASGRDEIDNLGHSLNELVKLVHWQVEHNATHDPLTGLLNRQGLERVLSELPYYGFEHRSRTSCLMLMDLDNFKIVNDGFGHDVGDALLVHVARQLTLAVRQGDIVARLGGDEFAVLLQNVQREAVAGFSQRILEHLRQPFTHNDMQVATTGSVGLAFCDGVSGPAELLRNADLAMYQAKQQGRDSCATFNDALKTEAQRRNRLEQALKQAVVEDGIQVVYQPVVDMVAQRVVSIEALARWSLDGEAVSPAEFIPIAEESGLIGKLGMQVLDKACGMVARLRRRGVDLPCSVNLSLRQFLEFNLVEDIPRVLASHGLPHSAVRLEITESLVAHSDAELALAMTELHRQGFEFMLDDFGTGHSSLYRLQALPFQTLKIDRSFVVPLDRGDDVMVRTVKDLAEQLNLQVVAEGVETQVELDHLLRLGVHRIQGFWVARPMSDPALLHWLASSPYTVKCAGGHEALDLVPTSPAPLL